MLDNHDREYQIRVIHEDQTEALSEWFKLGDIAKAIAAFRNIHAGAYWLRERNVAATARLLCPVEETAIAEYPLTDRLCSRARPNGVAEANSATGRGRGGPKIAAAARG